MQTVKMVVTGPFSSGKTEFIRSVSEIDVVSTERKISAEAEKIKETTTVAMDFGRITIRENLVIYLFGTPGQERFWFMWDELSRGALGAIVLADTRRLADSFASVDYFEQRGIPFVVGVNCFDGARRFRAESVRAALDLDPRIPVVMCDARQRATSRDALIALVEHALQVLRSRNTQEREGNRAPQPAS